MSAEYDFNFWDDEEDLPPIPEGFEPVRPPAPVVPKTTAPALDLPPIPEGFEPFQPPQAETATAPVDLPPIPEGFEPVPTPAPVTISSTEPAIADHDDHPAYHTKDPSVRPTDDLEFNGQRYLRNKFGIWNADTMNPVTNPEVIEAFRKSGAAKSARDQELMYQMKAPTRNFATEEILEAEKPVNLMNSLWRSWYALRQGWAAGDFVEADTALLEASKPQLIRGIGAVQRTPAEIKARQEKAGNDLWDALKRFNEFQGKLQEIPQSRQAERFANIKGFKEGLDLFMEDPFQEYRPGQKPLGFKGFWLAADLAAQSGAMSAPAVAGGVAGSVLGPVGSMVGAGAGSALTEYKMALAGAMNELGVDTTDRNAVLKAWHEHRTEILNNALVRSALVGAFDAFAAGLSTKLVDKIIGKGFKEKILQTLLGTTVEAPMGAAGEAAAELATTGKLSAPDILGEFAGEVPPGIVQTAGTVLTQPFRKQEPPPGLQLPPELGGPPRAERIEPQLFPDAPPPPAGEAPGPIPPGAGATPPPAGAAPVPLDERAQYDWIFEDPSDTDWIFGSREPPPGEPPPGEPPPVSEEGAPPTAPASVPPPPPGTAPMAPRMRPPEVVPPDQPLQPDVGEVRPPPPSAPIPPPSFRDTRGGVERWHGTASPIEQVEEGHYESLNYYGNGFYTSDAFDIAHGYTKKGRKRGQAPTPSYYKVEEINPVNAFDMEQPIPDFLVAHLQDGKTYGADDLAVEAMEQPEVKTVRDLYDYIRDYSQGSGFTADDVQTVFETFGDIFLENGYGAIDHRGGLRTGKKEHKVRIYLNPHEQIRIQRVDPETMRQPVPPSGGEQLRRIAFEAAPGEGSPYAAKFGEKFSALPFERQARVTDRVTAKAAELVNRLTGRDVGSVVHGTGGWQNFQNAAAVAQTVAPRHEVEAHAAALGYLLQQTEVWVNRATEEPGNSFAVDFMEIGSKNLSNNERLKELWQTVSEADSSGLIQGYQPITDSEGQVGIRVLIDQGGPETLAAVEASLNGPILDAVSRLPYNIRGRSYHADLTKLRNDWTQDPDGQVYLRRLAEAGIGTEGLDSLRGELEAEFGTALSESEARPAARQAPSRPLSETHLNVEVDIEGGEKATVRMRADRALAIANKRLKGLQRLMECVNGP